MTYGSCFNILMLENCCTIPHKTTIIVMLPYKTACDIVCYTVILAIGNAHNIEV